MVSGGHGSLDTWQSLIKGKVLFREPLSKYTTFRIGGPAEWMVFPLDLQDVQTAVAYAHDQGMKIFVLGGGSNLLVADEGIPGVVLNLSKGFNYAHFQDTLVIVGAGYSLPRLVTEAVKRGLTGLECATGVPGTVGGAVRMNAGTREAGIGDIIVQLKLLHNNGILKTLEQKDLKFQYRESNLPAESIILEVVLNLRKGNQKTLREDIHRRLISRKATQPLSYPNAGSIFKNPPGEYAGRLIEKVGLKGTRVGDAEISLLHGNFIVNKGSATAKDVMALIRMARQKVWKETGIKLELEVKLWGLNEEG
ncbi:MAG TPA: UDP-N-acetylmuramate dehydrogenase [Candidatus Limnocylindrales bacterium]|nr:UDP-N-acetylmuramate dehydrogenase [Candidatus Limnocylindrales bacterium]